MCECGFLISRQNVNHFLLMPIAFRHSVLFSIDNNALTNYLVTFHVVSTVTTTQDFFSLFFFSLSLSLSSAISYSYFFVNCPRSCRCPRPPITRFGVLGISQISRHPSLSFFYFSFHSLLSLLFSFFSFFPSPLTLRDDRMPK